MAKSKFSEKAYESMFIHELLTHFSKPGSTPFYIPSQVTENEVGYDCCFVDNSGNPINRQVLLIQFKISYEYTGISNEWDFRIDIYKSPKHLYKQHNKLCEYNNNYKPRIAAVYCAPCFASRKAFYDRVRTSNVIADSLFFDPVEEINDSDYHCIKFTSRKAEQFSKEGTEVGVHSFEELLQGIRPISKNQFSSLLEIIKNADKENIDDISEKKQKQKEFFGSSNSYYLFI